MPNRTDNYNLRPNPKTTERARNLSSERRETNPTGPKEDVRREENEPMEGTRHKGDRREERDAITIGLEQETFCELQDVPFGDYQHEAYDEGDRSATATPTLIQPDAITQILTTLQGLQASQNTVDSKLAGLQSSQQTLQENVNSQFEILQTSQQTLQNNVDLKLEGLQASQNNVDSKLEGLNNRLSNVKSEIFSEIKDILYKKNESLNLKLSQHKNHIQKQFDEFTHNAIETCSEKIEVRAQQLRAHTNERLDQQQQLIHEQHEKLQNTTSFLTETLNDHRNDISRNSTKINHLNNQLDTLEEQVTQLKENPNTLNAGVREIIVTCTGNNNNDLTLPKFNGRSQNPHEFINKFKTYFNRLTARRNNTNCPTFDELLEICLEGGASQWWQVTKNDITNLDQLEEHLIARYWNSDIQKGIRRRMEVEQFRPHGRLTRAEYFTERVILLQQMTPAIPEPDIVSLLAEHFEVRIQDARRVQNVNTIKSFVELLSREDSDEQNSKLKFNFTGTESHNRSHYNNNNSHNHRRPNEHNNPRREYDYIRPNDRTHQNNYSSRYNTYRGNQPNHYQRNNNNTYNNNNNNNNRGPYSPHRNNNQYNNNNNNHRHRNNPYSLEEQNRVCRTISANTQHNAPRPNLSADVRDNPNNPSGNA